MRFLRSRFLQAVLVLVLAFVILRFGIRPPAPWSVLTLYMAIIFMAVMVFVSSDRDSWRDFISPIWSTLVRPERRVLRIALVILIPLFVGYYAYTQAAAKPQAPPELRAVHPAPPASIQFRGKEMNISGAENPLRRDAAKFKEHVANGGAIYIRNCVYCHGDNLDGKGHFAPGFNPPPANFQDPGTIAMLQEAFLFWRIAKGGPGLPKESTPWNSVMPAWEDRLTEEQIWQVIMYLYDATGQQPRRWEAGKHDRTFGSIALALFAVAVTAAPAAAQDVNAGKAVYERKCMLCHGEKGDGNGPSAEPLLPKPRDFTKGLYKIRTTANRPPTDQDLFRIITDGMPGTSMPSWAVLPDRDRHNVVAYIKTFAADVFKEAPKKLELPKEVSSSEASIKRGKEMFEAIECHKCHGTEGRADGPSRPELKDEWGHPVAPANLAKRWNFRGGHSRTDIATRIANGVLGTPMPAFLDAVEKPEDIWHLTNYIVSLGPAAPQPATLVTVSAVRDAIPDDPGAEFWKKVEPNNILLEGQVIVDPRNFNPAIDLVSVRAVYNDKEIAFHLTWDDPGETKGDGKTTFPDAISLQFAPQQPTGTERPYFLMGDADDGVYLLRWEQGKGVTEVTAHGPTKLTPIQGGEAAGKAVFKNGQYTLVMKRQLAVGGAERPSFRPRVFTPVAFQAWEGGAGETGPKMSLTSWYYLRLEEPQSNRRFFIPPAVALLTFAALGMIVRAARNRAVQ